MLYLLDRQPDCFRDQLGRKGQRLSPRPFTLATVCHMILASCKRQSRLIWRLCGKGILCIRLRGLPRGRLSHGTARQRLYRFPHGRLPTFRPPADGKRPRSARLGRLTIRAENPRPSCGLRGLIETSFGRNFLPGWAVTDWLTALE